MSAIGALPFELEALEAWLERAGIASAPVVVQRIGDGHSNLTYAVSAGGRSVVLRRPPPRPFPPGAYDVLREARILQALAGSDVPVPTVLGVAGEGEAMDVPFYIMEHLEGEVCTSTLPAGLDDAEQRRRVGEALVDALGALHAVDWRARGLEDLGRPDGFLKRQLTRLPRIIADADGSLPAEFAELRDELAGSMPESGPPALLHGDLRLGNVILTRQAPARIVGVLDWELAAIGDPLADLAYTLATYAAPGEPSHALTELSTATLADGFPNREELAARYARASGRDVSELPWYEALQLFKLGVLFEYSRRRGEDPYYADPRLVEDLLAAARGALSTERGC